MWLVKMFHIVSREIILYHKVPRTPKRLEGDVVLIQQDYSVIL